MQMFVTFVCFCSDFRTEDHEGNEDSDCDEVEFALIADMAHLGQIAVPSLGLLHPQEFAEKSLADAGSMTGAWYLFQVRAGNIRS
jgi:hypothetical protein